MQLEFSPFSQEQEKFKYKHLGNNIRFTKNFASFQRKLPAATGRKNESRLGLWLVLEALLFLFEGNSFLLIFLQIRSWDPFMAASNFELLSLGMFFNSLKAACFFRESSRSSSSFPLHGTSFLWYQMITRDRITRDWSLFCVYIRTRGSEGH